MSDKEVVQAFVITWFVVVTTVLTIFGLCKIGGHMFDLSSGGNTQVNAKQAFVDACRSSEYGQRFGVPNVSGSTWTCVIPNGSSK